MIAELCGLRENELSFTIMDSWSIQNDLRGFHSPSLFNSHQRSIPSPHTRSSLNPQNSHSLPPTFPSIFHVHPSAQQQPPAPTFRQQSSIVLKQPRHYCDTYTNRSSTSGCSTIITNGWWGSVYGGRSLSRISRHSSPF